MLCVHRRVARILREAAQRQSQAFDAVIARRIFHELYDRGLPQEGEKAQAVRQEVFKFPAPTSMGQARARYEEMQRLIEAEFMNVDVSIR